MFRLAIQLMSDWPRTLELAERNVLKLLLLLKFFFITNKQTDRNYLLHAIVTLVKVYSLVTVWQLWPPATRVLNTHHPQHDTARKFIMIQLRFDFDNIMTQCQNGNIYLSFLHVIIMNGKPNKERSNLLWVRSKLCVHVSINKERFPSLRWNMNANKSACRQPFGSCQMCYSAFRCFHCSLSLQPIPIKAIRLQPSACLTFLEWSLEVVFYIPKKKRIGFSFITRYEI